VKLSGASLTYFRWVSKKSATSKHDEKCASRRLPWLYWVVYLMGMGSVAVNFANISFQACVIVAAGLFGGHPLISMTQGLPGSSLGRFLQLGVGVCPSEGGQAVVAPDLASSPRWLCMARSLLSKDVLSFSMTV